MTWIIAIIAAYVIGSIPFGVIIARSKGIDIRAHGSGNVGATNVGRVLGRRIGILCFVLDMIKGAGPVVGAGLIHGVFNKPADHLAVTEMLLWLAVAAAAVIGHMHSIFLRLTGGKGVATAFGAIVAMWPLLTVPAVIAIVIWAVVVRLSRLVSLASIVAAMSIPVVTVVWLAATVASAQSITDWIGAVGHGWPLLAVTSVLAVFVVYKHRTNIARIRRGEEPTIGGR